MDARTGRALGPGKALGRIAALVALLGLLLGGVMPMPAVAIAGMDPAQAPICHGGGQAADRQVPHAPPQDHHQGACQSCCLLHGVHAHAAILTDRPGLAQPSLRTRRLVMALPQSRAPPAQAEDAAYPRGPPTLA